MAIYSGDLASLTQGSIAQQNANRADQIAQQQYLLGLAQERNRRALGEGQIGAENYRTTANRDVGMGGVGVGYANVDARNAEIMNLLKAAQMRDALERERLKKQDEQFYYGTGVQESLGRGQLDENRRQFDAMLPTYGSLGSDGRYVDPSVFKEVNADYQDKLAQQQRAVELARRLNTSVREPAIASDATWFGNLTGGALGSDSVAKIMAELQAGNPNRLSPYNEAMTKAINVLPIEDAQLVELDPRTATVVPRQILTPGQQAPVIPISPRAVNFPRTLLNRVPALQNFRFDPSRFQRQPAN